MQKLIAILNVVAWGGFWAFGYLALTAGADAGGRVVFAVILAAVGGALGIWAYLWLVRHSEATGYARPARRVQKPDDTDLNGERA
ncbi:MAG: hypothetical protein O2898_00695 [Proteobacteria bacterium]|nr:hypothetical protein [Pseudomonadota bacterium]